MEIKYVVNGVEFTNKEHARQYEINLNLSKAKFKEDQTVYFWNSAANHPVMARVKKIICETRNNEAFILYKLHNMAGMKMESSLYASWNDLTDAMWQKCRDLR